jgi:hypothetical protein
MRRKIEQGAHRCSKVACLTVIKFTGKVVILKEKLFVQTDQYVYFEAFEPTLTEAIVL